jgi:hypothetical protein
MVPKLRGISSRMDITLCGRRSSNISSRDQMESFSRVKYLEAIR